MRTGPASIEWYYFVIETPLDNGKKFYYDLRLPFWNIVNAKTWINSTLLPHEKLIELFKGEKPL